MTDKDKLEKLITTALNNGWIPLKDVSKIIIMDSLHQLSPNLVIDINLNLIINNIYNSQNLNVLSINDIVLDYESNGSVSFIGALLKALKEKEKELVVFKDGSTERNLRVSWISRPSSLRLSYLFTLFDSLLN